MFLLVKVVFLFLTFTTCCCAVVFYKWETLKAKDESISKVISELTKLDKEKLAKAENFKSKTSMDFEFTVMNKIRTEILTTNFGITKTANSRQRNLRYQISEILSIVFPTKVLYIIAKIKMNFTSGTEKNLRKISYCCEFQQRILNSFADFHHNNYICKIINSKYL